MIFSRHISRALSSLAITVTIFLSACGGGGGAEEPEKFIGPPDCRNNPQACL
jgi:hypothetical protein